jgi:hypothetical protein
MRTRLFALFSVLLLLQNCDSPPSPSPAPHPLYDQISEIDVALAVLKGEKTEDPNTIRWKSDPESQNELPLSADGYLYTVVHKVKFFDQDEQAFIVLETYENPTAPKITDERVLCRACWPMIGGILVRKNSTGQWSIVRANPGIEFNGSPDILSEVHFYPIGTRKDGRTNFSLMISGGGSGAGGETTHMCFFYLLDDLKTEIWRITTSHEYCGEYCQFTHNKFQFVSLEKEFSDIRVKKTSNEQYYDYDEEAEQVGDASDLENPENVVTSVFYYTYDPERGYIKKPN